jgi:hypothetical protein
MTCVFSAFSVAKAKFGSPYSVNASSLMPTSWWLYVFLTGFFGVAVAADAARPAATIAVVASRAMRLDTQ